MVIKVSGKLFEIKHKDKKTNARSCIIHTKSGSIETPFFMPVATKATVKYISPDDLLKMKNTAVISNAFVLYLRPGDEFFKKIGGIKKFMNYHGINVTDSGGFQMYKDTFLIETNENGVLFKSPFDGTKHFVTPEKDMEIQMNIDSDIAMCLDSMPLTTHSKDKILDAIKKTTTWAKRCKIHHDKINKGRKLGKKQLLFAITQGGIYPDLRKQSCMQLKSINVDGFSIGGLALGEPRDKMFEMVKIHKSIMPENKPCYLMGVGSPIDLLEAIALGVDMFDSRFPTQNARRGTIFTSQGKLRILRNEYKYDQGPLDPNCDCYVCKNFSRAYIRYQLSQEEGTGYRLATFHQLYYLMRLMEKAREAIKNNSFLGFKSKVVSIYRKEDNRIRIEQVRKHTLSVCSKKHKV